MAIEATKAYQDLSRIHERNDLVVQHLGFVRHVLGRLTVKLPRNIDMENLEAAGLLGLVEASHAYDPSRGTSFPSFAYQRVWGAIIDELRRNSPLPQQMLKHVSKIQKARERLEPPVTVEILAEATNLTVDEVEDALEAARLTRPTELDEHEFGWLVHQRDNSVSSQLEMDETKRILADCIETLPEQQRLVVTLYYVEELRLKEIGKVMNLSESRVSRILTKAHLALEEAVRAKGG